MKKFIRGFIIFIVFIILLCIPALICFLLSCEDFSDYFNKLHIQNGDLINFIAEYLSLGVTLLLGVIVFFQSQKINKLEATQYNTYIGVTNTDYSSDIGDTLAAVCEQKDFDLSYLFEESKFEENNKIILSNLIFNNMSTTQISIPLRFVTRNKPLIVSIKPTKVKVKMKDNEGQVYKKKEKIKKAVICSLLGDNSDFVWHFGLFVPDKEFDEVEINIFTTIKDQNNNKQKLKTKVRLYKNATSSKFVLTYSETVKRGVDLV